MKLKAWIQAARLRTLPLSLSGIIVGSFAAYAKGFWDAQIFGLAMLTTLFLQVLSNFANDLGDSYKGADNAYRVGPERAIQSGQISQVAMGIAVIIMSLLSLGTSIALIYIGTSDMPEEVLWTYIFLAIACVLAAITYTLGKKAYGYNGLGDIMVFIFFGLVSVLGVYTLYSKAFDISIIGFAITIGFLSVAVLNLNNMRDHENDAKVGKNTIVVIMGYSQAKYYHATLIIAAFLAALTTIVINEWWVSLIAIAPFAILFFHIKRVWLTLEPKDLDPELKKVALSTFAIAVLFLISTLL